MFYRCLVEFSTTENTKISKYIYFLKFIKIFNIIDCNFFINLFKLNGYYVCTKALLNTIQKVFIFHKQKKKYFK